MARPRKPSALLDARGAFKKNPQRARVEPEAAGPLGAAPPDLEPDVRAAWDFIAENAPLGVLTAADRMAVEIAANLYAEFRRAPADFPPAKLTRLQSLLGACGMTPADRARLAIKPPKKPDASPFAAFG